MGIGLINYITITLKSLKNNTSTRCFNIESMI